MNIRLDYINNIEQYYLDKMTEIRAMYMKIDDYLVDAVTNKDAATIRAMSLARTNLETSLQYAIKTLCLSGEKKERHDNQ